MTEELSRTTDPTTEADAGQALWQSCLEQLAQDLPAQQFNTWIKPLAAQITEDFSRITLYVPNRFTLDWIRAQYAGRIAGLLESLYGQSLVLELALAQRTSSARTRIASSSAALPIPVHMPVESMQTGDDSPRGAPRNRLNAALTFDTLIEGTANRMARAAAIHVASMPGHLYNPLFIYGGVGLGKTHLVHAVGNKLLADRPDAKVLYIHAEQFVSDVVKAYQRKTFEEFKERYHSLDLLLIDDVQFFANKDRTQEEFFNAFETLLAKKSHIVMTSDTYPKGLSDIHERLVSRFDSGLTVAIEPPELEMRVAILMNKARTENVHMPEEVAFFVAKNVRSNVRELEGALRKILAYSRFNQKEISIQMAREALRDLLSIQNRQISVENIQKNGGRLLQNQDRRHVQQKAPGQHCPAAPNCHVLGQRADAKKPARDWRAVWRARSHHRAARGAQDFCRAPATDRTEPATARAGANPQRVSACYCPPAPLAKGSPAGKISGLVPWR